MATAAHHGTRPMTIRRMRFRYPDGLGGAWNPAQPLFSHIVNAASLAMPFLEPYLIATMRQARARLDDPALIADVDQYIGQESAHYRQHQQFNRRLADMGYASVAASESVLKADYQALASDRSFSFNLAYAEGFEAMALAIGHMLVEDRVYLFGEGDPAVASLILWHFVEEIEHKCVTFDVFEALDGRYAWRIFGLAYATIHIMARTRQGYRKLLLEDGLWRNWRARLALYRLLGRIFRRLLPRFARIMRPGYNPREVADPAWVHAWWQSHAGGEADLGQLDMARLGDAQPVVAA